MKNNTGFRIRSKTQWLHVIGTRWLTSYRTSARRGEMPSGVKGCLVHDHWGPYFTLPGVVHAMCNAHHLRELQALVEIDKEVWAGQLQRLLRLAHRVVRRARARDLPLPPWLVASIEARYGKLLRKALEYHESQPVLRAAQRGRRGARNGGRDTTWRCGWRSAESRCCASCTSPTCRSRTIWQSKICA